MADAHSCCPFHVLPTVVIDPSALSLCMVASLVCAIPPACAYTQTGYKALIALDIAAACEGVSVAL